MNLTNHFLIAWPNINDPIFGGTVVYLCEHNPHGSLGIIINKPLDLTLDRLINNMNPSLKVSQKNDDAVMFGGPVQENRGFALHSPDNFQFISMLKLSDEIAFTSSRDILETVASGQRPNKLLVTLGYSGWSGGQLEDEIKRNSWLITKADPSIIFDLPINERYTAAMNLLGVDPVLLSGQIGHD